MEIALIDKYRSKGILVDTNLLLLLAVGFYRSDRIANFNRTRQYTSDDFSLLKSLLAPFGRLLTTPQILAETDNLMRQMPERERGAIANVSANLIGRMFETYIPSVDASRHERYPDVGLTDAVTIIASEDVLVLTDDARLWSILAYLGRDAVNINHLRGMTLS